MIKHTASYNSNYHLFKSSFLKSSLDILVTDEAGSPFPVPDGACSLPGTDSLFPLVTALGTREIFVLLQQCMGEIHHRSIRINSMMLKLIIIGL